MPFNLSQIFGGWRKKELKTRKPPDGPPRSSHPRLTLPAGRGSSDASHGPSEVRPSKIEPIRAKSHSELARKLLTSPHISEKATMLGEGRYVFKVADGANKSALKKAVRDRYGVEVRSVNIVAERDKTRRRGQIAGVKSGFKKAVVTLKAGQVISEF